MCLYNKHIVLIFTSANIQSVKSVIKQSNNTYLSEYGRDRPVNYLASNYEIHIWHIKYDENINFDIDSASSLSKVELTRAKLFKSLPMGQQWAFFHVALRDILSRYLNLCASDIEFCLDQNKKPLIAHVSEPPLFFNLTHSGRYARVAISSVAPVGVDIEVCKAIQDAENVVQRFFSKQEIQQLADVNKNLFHQSFYQVWTAKEALIKANGLGMSAPLDAFDVMVEKYSNWYSPTLRNPLVNTGVYWLKHLATMENIYGALSINIVDPKVIKWFDIKRVTLKEMVFEYNNL
jgi:phosphopantetheinyl transferase